MRKDLFSFLLLPPGPARPASASDSLFPFSVANACGLLFLAGMLAIFVFCFTRTGRHEDAHQREVEAARTVQQILIPATIPDVPGFSIRTIYKPASQDGGDFFQVISAGTGGLPVGAGDGGLPAATAVSLLVGTVRTLVHFTQNPGEILGAMNQRMLARTRGDLTTRFVMRLDPDGLLTVADAGHLAPYLRSEEFAVEGSPTLELVAEPTCNEGTSRLSHHKQLTGVTDGVVEARGGKCESPGSERMTAPAVNAAVEDAGAAQRRGRRTGLLCPR